MSNKPTYEELEQRVKKLEREALGVKQVEKALRESEARLRTAIGSLPFDFFLIGSDGRYAMQNAICKKHWGDIVGKRPEDVASDKEILALWEGNNKRALAGEVVEEEVRFSRGDGKRHYYNIVSPIRDGDQIKGILGVNIDITERKLAEKKLKESIDTWRVTFNTVPVLALMVDDKGCILEANKAFAKRFGKDLDELTGICVFDLLPPDVAERRKSYFDQVMESGQSVRFEDERNGTWFVSIVCSIVDEEGRVIKVAWLVRDITDSKRAEEALRESERMYRTFVRTSPDAVLIADAGGHVTDISEQLIQMVGYSSSEEVLGKSGFSFMVPEDRERARKTAQNRLREEGYLADQQYTFLRKDGSQFVGQVSAVVTKDELGNPKSYILSVRDATEQKRVTDELIKAQKLESLGILAGGIAHDFNNILTVITANISMAKIFGDFSDDVSKMLTDAEIASERAKNLTQQLLTFAKGGTPIKKPFAISRLLRTTTEFALSGSNVRCDYGIPEDLWTVIIDEGQISQVIQNLVVNAKQAMPEGGIMKLRAENVVLRKKDLIPLRPGKYVKITVKDQGKGIPETQLQRVFDPFFTTKSEGKGLGLAIASSIVKNHDGHIDVTSKAGIGTTFYVYLPASQRSMSSKEKEKEKPLGGEGRILLVDDNEFVRRSAGLILKRLGYEVESAKDGAEGIELYKRAKETEQPFDVVIMDLTIPGGMGGKEAVKEITRIDPHAKVIVSSGYSDDEVMSKFKKYGFSGILRKPYRIEEVDEAIRKVTKKGL